MCGTCHRCGQVSQFLFIAPFPDNRQKFTQCRLPNSTLHASKLSERERQRGSKIHQSVTNHPLPDLDGARASRSQFAVGGPKIRMPPPQVPQPKQPRKKRSERASRTLHDDVCAPSLPLFAIPIGAGRPRRPTPKNDMEHLDGSKLKLSRSQRATTHCHLS